MRPSVTTTTAELDAPIGRLVRVALGWIVLGSIGWAMVAGAVWALVGLF